MKFKNYANDVFLNIEDLCVDRAAWDKLCEIVEMYVSERLKSEVPTTRYFKCWKCGRKIESSDLGVVGSMCFAATFNKTSNTCGGGFNIEISKEEYEKPHPNITGWSTSTHPESLKDDDDLCK